MEAVRQGLNTVPKIARAYQVNKKCVAIAVYELRRSKWLRPGDGSGLLEETNPPEPPQPPRPPTAPMVPLGPYGHVLFAVTLPDGRVLEPPRR